MLDARSKVFSKRTKYRVNERVSDEFNHELELSEWNEYQCTFFRTSVLLQLLNVSLFFRLFKVNARRIQQKTCKNRLRIYGKSFIFRFELFISSVFECSMSFGYGMSN